MLFGKSASARGQEAIPPRPEGSFIFDATVADFEDKVLKASMEKPVIADFWAPWCGPCKTLGPLLEKAVAAAGGKVLMAKIDIDKNQELATALRIQSIPTVYAFYQGRPIDGFQGALPESQIREFVEKIVQIARQSAPEALNIPEALKMAADLLNENDPESAQALYTHILQEDENNALAYAGLLRTLVAGGQVEQATALAASAPEKIKADAHFKTALSALELAQLNPAGNAAELMQKIQRDPGDHQSRFDLANLQFAAGAREEAMENLLEIMRRSRQWQEDGARKQLIKFFEAIGPSDPLTLEGRRKLSSLLFS